MLRLNIAAGELHQRVEVAGNNEISDLGNTFNIMSERLENMDAMKTEFVSNASHELKTPLSSIKILVQSLIFQKNVDEAVYRDFLNDINMEMDRLNDVISDLLLLTKIEDEASALNLEKLSFSELVERAVKGLQVIADNNNVDLDLNIGNDVALYVDELKLSIAVVNLVENAIKYTDSGGHVLVSVFSKGSQAFVEVKDNGPGIPKDELERIFERFYRVDKARARKTGGTGLGLHISQRIVRLHGGEITVASDYGKGSTFTLMVPIKTDIEG